MRAESIDYQHLALRVLEDAPVLIVVLDMENRIQHVNPFCERVTGYRLDEVRGKESIEAFIPPHERDRIGAALVRRQTADGERSGVGPIVTRSGEVRQIDWTGTAVRDEEGRPIGLLVIGQDVTERVAAEAQITASLREKEMLLREIHHRVKNNLQVISSLLHFHGKKLRSPEDEAAFTELRQRIYAMTLVHERLYKSPDVARVDLGDYVPSLVAELTRSIRPRPGVRIDVATDDVCLPIELALPSGMIVCELITNVLKYAFPDAREGKAVVSVRRAGDRIVIGVDDDGVGFPTGFDVNVGSSFGWELIRSLVLQLDGVVEATTNSGAHVSVSFAAPVAGAAPVTGGAS